MFYNILILRFKSNYFGKGLGFKFGYDASETSEWTYNGGDCGGNFTTLNGFLTSPSYPQNYPENAKCDYVIKQPAGRYINLIIQMFNTFDKDCGDWVVGDASSEDGFDYLEVRDGNSEKSPLIGRFCGNQIPASMHSTSNNMWIRYAYMHL